MDHINDVTECSECFHRDVCCLEHKKNRILKIISGDEEVFAFKITIACDYFVNGNLVVVEED